MDVVNRDLRVMDLTADHVLQGDQAPDPCIRPDGSREPWSCTRRRGDRYADRVTDDDLSQVVIADTRDRMDKAVEHTRGDFSTVRTGRATPGLVEHLRIDVYGAEVELRTIAGLSVPEARLLVISPYDKSSIVAIEKAIQTSDLGINPSNDGTVIRLGVLHHSPRRDARTW